MKNFNSTFLWLLLASGVFTAPAATIDFSTTTITGWKVDAGGAVDSTPFPFGTELSISSTGTGIGNFVDGGTWSGFDGFWTATYSFFLPAGATQVSLAFSDLYADDRAVLELNGNRIAATGIAYNGNATSGSMVLSDGTTSLPYAFDGGSGTVSGTVTTGFIFGGMNTLYGIVNNTGTGVYGALLPIYEGASNDGTHFGVSGFVSYMVVPEPDLWGFGLASCALFLKNARSRS